VAFDRSGEIVPTSRFVIVDGYDIAGGGIVRERVADDDVEGGRAVDAGPEIDWIAGDVSLDRRAAIAGHPASLVLFVGDLGTGKHVIARKLEAALVESGHRAYLLDGHNPFRGTPGAVEQTEVIHRYVEVAQVLLDAGTLVISTNNVVGLAEHAPIVARVSPHPALTIRLGPALAQSPTDLRFDANTEASVAVPAILAELGKRGLARSQNTKT
jgi:bifunctional enzyme CysN/CysC